MGETASFHVGRLIVNFYYLIRNNTVYIKEQEFFQQQREETKKTDPNDKWFEAWKFCYEDVDGINHARLLIQTKYMNQ